LNPDVDARALRLLDGALELEPSAREAWIGQACGDDVVLLDRTLALLRAGQKSHRLLTGGAAAAAREHEAPARVGAYRITGLIGQGGMGAVYRGERDAGDFQHAAAIKLVRPGALSDALVDRFQRERQILASLSHAHIARLFDGGETPAGEPYMIMELVDGVPLDVWMEREAPALDRKVAMFMAVCSAVAFAHQNLIVHRDITPSNILVSADGAPKLIDFGISRPPESGQGSGRQDQAGPTSATPGFAAPERRAGDSATTLTDVYSLGVLLGRLTEGVRDLDLKAIIACATATDPAARYVTVDALAADVAAWREGRAVAARRGGRRYQLSKFVLRHRWPVSAGLVSTILLVAALAATLVANRREEIARAEAEARFQQTRAIANVLLFDAYDEVSKVPGAIKARVLLAETGQAYLTALSQMTNPPVDVQAETGAGFTRLSQVVGGGGDSHQGRLEDAGKLLARAEAVLEPLHAAHPQDPHVMRAYAAMLHEQVATAIYNDNDPVRARAKSAQIRTVLAPIVSHDVESARLLAGSWQGTGDSYAWSDDFPRARDAYLAAEEFINRLAPPTREARDVRMVRSANLRLLGEAYHQLGDAGAARDVLDRAVEVNRSLVSNAPEDPALIRKLAISLWYRATVHRANQRLELASRSIEEAVTLARRLQDRSNGDATSTQLMALTGEVQAQVFSDLHRSAEAYAIGDEVVAAHRRLVTLAGGAPGARRSMASALNTLGDNLYNGAQYQRACALWRESESLWLELASQRELSAYDQANGQKSIRQRLAANCENGPPRRGMAQRL
jgi:tetratricopeptide (TPR) repeat protein